MDYCGVSIFLQPYMATDSADMTSSSPSAMKYLDAMAEFCNGKQIPVMIAESTPFGGTLKHYYYYYYLCSTPIAGYLRIRLLLFSIVFTTAAIITTTNTTTTISAIPTAPTSTSNNTKLLQVYCPAIYNNY